MGFPMVLEAKNGSGGGGYLGQQVDVALVDVDVAGGAGQRRLTGAL